MKQIKIIVWKNKEIEEGREEISEEERREVKEWIMKGHINK